jgi:hypothetical protein
MESLDYPGRQTKLGWMQFSFCVYFLVCSGGFGSEAMIKTGGPFFTLLFLGIMPFLWSLPLVMVTAELGSAMPSNEGYPPFQSLLLSIYFESGVFLWVRVALGRSAAFCIAIIYWLNYLIGTALYPIILDR